MRKVRICEIPDEFTAFGHDERITKQFRFELITPMFGGDAESWKLDLKNPVRGQAVKGQLRFWWRTMQGDTDPEELLRKENALWGGKIDQSRENRSRIRSRVFLSISDYDMDQKDIVRAEMANNYAVDDNVMPTNVLFPITSMVRDGADVYFITKMSFTLNISYPKTRETEVRNTLKLWCLFGGIGARTRRGTGSIYCEELLREFTDESDLFHFIQEISDSETDALSYPRLSGMKLYIGKSSGEPSSAWHAFLQSYGRFRQDRVPRKPKPGRSHWPEPDAIRQITGPPWATGHAPVHPDGKWFPRAAFGLPILFKFITPGDPGGGSEINIEPDIGTGERYPSPVILKVIKLPNGALFKCALVLNQKFPDRLKLKVNHHQYPLTGPMLPFHPGYKHSKTMRVGHPLSGASIYENLANHLSLKEVP